jgi:glucosamine-phosphate N-acetyltransferase
MSSEPPELMIRLMDATDLNRGFLETLDALKPTGLSHQQAIEIYRNRLKSRLQTYVALMGDRIVGTASVFIEPKFIHSGGVVGHIEDVSVNSESQKHGIGRALVEHLLSVCRRNGCYKVILDCAPDLVPYYERMGFYGWANAMRFDLHD